MSKRTLDGSAKRILALRLKQEGFTYADIGRHLGISRQRAQQLVSPPKSERSRAIERAEGRCQACGERASKLDFHHSDYKRGADAILCPSCHRIADARLGLTAKGPHRLIAEIGKMLVASKLEAMRAECDQIAAQLKQLEALI